jgi:hypothetical protein
METGRINSSNQIPAEPDPFNSEPSKPKITKNSPETLEYWAKIQKRFNAALENLIRDSKNTPPKDPQ